MRSYQFDSKNQSVTPTEIPRHPRYIHYSDQAIKDRISWTSNLSGASLKHITRTCFDPETLAGNIENYIGAVQIPVGIAGPILINRKDTSSYIPVPIAATEGALVTSLTRGAKACSLSGGINVHIKQQQMIRAPVFFCTNMRNAIDLEKWIYVNIDWIKAKAESVSNIAKLLKVDSDVFGDTLHVRFYYFTGDAAGQNMTTASTWHACEWIQENIKEKTLIGLRHYYIDGNTSCDKKLAFKSFINGRGISVTASCLVTSQILETMLKTTAEKYLEGWQAGEVGSLQSGMIGSNMNFSNIVAGIFTATGQDIACVHESSSGIFKVMPREGGLLFTASLPSLVIGTVGGGTGLPTQKECLNIMGCSGSGKINRLAEIIAAACLSLDLSTGAAIANNSFVAAHEKLGRNRPKTSFSLSDIDTKLFNEMLFDPKKRVLRKEKIKLKDNFGIITALPKDKDAITGIHRYKLAMETDQKRHDISVVLKVKNSDSEVLKNGYQIAKLSGDDNLPGLFAAQEQIFGFNNSCLREIEFYSRMNPKIKRFCPNILGTKTDPSRDLYAILMEDLKDESHLNTINNPSLWKDPDIKSVLSDMAAMHSVFFDRFDTIPKQIGISGLDEVSGKRSIRLLTSLTELNGQRYPDLFDKELIQTCTAFIKKIGHNISAMKKFHMTLVHNDFNPRNLCLRTKRDKKQLVLYDWELVSFQNPQIDLVEFLVSVLPENYSLNTFYQFVDHYRVCLQDQVETQIPEDEFINVLHLNALYLAVTRYNLYLLAHNILNFKFINRIYSNLTRCILNIKRRA